MDTAPGESQTKLSALVAEEIRVVMTRRRMSGRQLAAALHVSPSWVSYRLTGTQPIDLDDLEQIAKVLKCRLVDLLPPESRTQPTDPDAPLGRSADQPNTRPRSARPADTRPNGRPDAGNVRRPQRRTAQIPANAMTLSSGAWAA